MSLNWKQMLNYIDRVRQFSLLRERLSVSGPIVSKDFLSWELKPTNKKPTTVNFCWETRESYHLHGVILLFEKIISCYFLRPLQMSRSFISFTSHPNHSCQTEENFIPLCSFSKLHWFTFQLRKITCFDQIYNEQWPPRNLSALSS